MSDDIIPVKTKIKPLTAHQRQIINETAKAILVSGTYAGASKILKISDVALYKRRKKFKQIDAIVNERLSDEQKIAKNVIISDVVNSANMLLKLRNANSEAVQLNAVVKALSLAGLVEPKTNNNIQVNIANLTNQDKNKFDL